MRLFLQMVRVLRLLERMHLLTQVYTAMVIKSINGFESYIDIVVGAILLSFILGGQAQACRFYFAIV